MALDTAEDVIAESPPCIMRRIAEQAAAPPAGLSKEEYIPNRVYVDPEIFERERERIFYRTWNLVLHTSELEGPGAYRTVDVAGMPIVVCRDQNGALRAFYNVCRHRGCQIATEPSGCVKRFQCKYHLWNYSLGGEMIGQGLELKGVAQPLGYEGTGFDRKNFPLVEVQVDTALGFIFVNLDPEAEPLEEFLGGVLEDPRVREVVGDHLDVFHLHQQLVHCNWKLFVDNSREGYHVNLHEFVRRTSPELLDLKNKSMQWHNLGNGHLAVYADGDSAAMDYGKMGYDDGGGSKLEYPLPGMAKGGFFILHLFPDIMINVRSNAMRVDRMVPIDATRTLVEWRGLGLRGDNEEVRASRVANHNLVWGPFGRQLAEDVIAVEWQMNALRYGSRAIRYAVIARHADLTFTDDIEVREFYNEWAKLMEFQR
jgi:phenylpropionate dioxygenase-like ring-hydroxylating dioxygenase large terminal subunit